jgi:MFS family permease
VAAVILGLSAIGKPSLGAFADHIGGKYVLGSGPIITGVGYLTLLGASRGWVIVSAVMLVGFTLAAPVGLVPMALAETLGLKRFGSLMGWLGLIFTFGLFFGPLVVGRMSMCSAATDTLTRRSQRLQLSRDFLVSYAPHRSLPFGDVQMKADRVVRQFGRFPVAAPRKYTGLPDPRRSAERVDIAHLQNKLVNLANYRVLTATYRARRHSATTLSRAHHRPDPRGG